MNNRFNFIKGLLKVTVLSAAIVYGILKTGQYISSVQPLKISEPEIAQTNLNDAEVKKSAPEKKRKKTVKKEKVNNQDRKKVAEVKKADENVKTDDVVQEEKKEKIKYSFKVEKLKIIQLPDDKYIRMTFRLKNMTKGNRVKGRMFMKFYKGNNVYFYPDTTLKDGNPEDLENGVFYNIKRYKKVEVTIDKGVDLKQFSDVEFYIYEDSNGTVPVYTENHKLRVESGDIFLNPY